MKSLVTRAAWVVFGMTIVAQVVGCGGPPVQEGTPPAGSVGAGNDTRNMQK